jgi:hypothetical protein
VRLILLSANFSQNIEFKSTDLPVETHPTKHMEIFSAGRSASVSSSFGFGFKNEVNGLLDAEAFVILTVDMFFF